MSISPEHDIRLLYVTAESHTQALMLARRLVELDLVACANILGEISSVYKWNGAVTESTEVALLLKTTKDMVDTVVATVRELHSYECPCTISVSVDGGDRDFMSWVVNAISKKTV